MKKRTIKRPDLHKNVTNRNTKPRKGWKEAAKEMHKNGDDKLDYPDVFEDEEILPY